MRFNKQVQYGLLLVLYLQRSGTASLKSVSEQLKLSRSFLEQVARRLRIAKVIESTLGAHGGYSVLGNPSLADVISILAPESLVSESDYRFYKYGEPEHRALARIIEHHVKINSFFLKEKIRDIDMDQVNEETEALKSAGPTETTN